MEHFLALLLGIFFIALIFATMLGVMSLCLWLGDMYRQRHPKDIFAGPSKADKWWDRVLAISIVVLLLIAAYGFGMSVMASA